MGVIVPSLFIGFSCAVLFSQVGGGAQFLAAPMTEAQLPVTQQATRVIQGCPAPVLGAMAAAMLAAPANAATVKLGSDSGGLVFEPSSITIKAGETVEWVNNAGFPHNVIFDEDAVPEGVNADALSAEDLLNAPGEKHTAKFEKAGEYSYYCQPHQGAGMVGKVIVQ